VNKLSPAISIVVIGRNSKESLHKLLLSINKIQHHKYIKEVVYVDDASSDESENLFKNFNLMFSKTCVKLNTNKGRSFARQKGAEVASGEWFLFLNSNVRVDSLIIKAYLQHIKKKPGVAYAGLINYSSTDLKFQNYLNNSKRGLRKFKGGSFVPCDHLLFSNCLIKNVVFQHLQFNYKLNHYGGEELDFSYKIGLKYPKQTIAANSAQVTREGSPVFKIYCKKLFEFGNTNFLLLNPALQKRVVKFNFLLNKNIFLFLLIKIVFRFCLGLYSFVPVYVRFYIIRLGMLSAILCGYYKSK